MHEAPQGSCRARSALVLLLALVWSQAAAHEVPAQVRVQVYLAVEDQALIALVRAPLEAMRDLEFPRRGPGYLDLRGAERQLQDAVSLWLTPNLGLFADGVRLPAPELIASRLALPSDPSFASFERARRAVHDERLPVGTELYWEQALLDVALRYPLADAAADLELEPTFARLGLRTVTEIRFLRAEAEPRSFAFVGDPGRVSLAPGGGAVFSSFLADGFRHVLGGLDHLLFLAALIAPVRRIRPLIVIVTAFTVAHSITLVASMFDIVPRALWFPALVESLIAASIVYMALENIVRPGLERRWLVAYGFGLVHGFGFSFALGETLQLAGDHLAASLLAFNLGIELGQLLLLVLAVPVWRWLLRRAPERALVVLASAFIAHSGWHWLLERWQTFDLYALAMPPLEATFWAMAARWLMLLLTAVLVVVLVRHGVARFQALGAERPERA